MYWIAFNGSDCYVTTEQWDTNVVSGPYMEYPL